MPRLMPAGVVVLLTLFLSQTANGQVLDTRFQADIEKLLEVTGAGAVGAQMATLVSNQMIDAMKQAQPGTPERAIAIVKEVLSSEFSRAFEGPDGLRGKMVGIYARHFTHEEVVALLNFYNTDVGRKTISVMPKLAQEGAAAGQEWAAANMMRVGGVVQQRLRAEGFIP